MITFDRAALDALPRRERANFLNGLSGFKSANLLGTADANGRTNLALMSSVFHVGAAPPLLGLLIRPHTVPRHSLENLLERGEYTLNHVAESFHERAHLSSASQPREVSEFESAGLTPAWSPNLSAPYVAESPVQIGLRLREHHTLTSNGCVLVVGEVCELRLREDTRSADGQLDLQALGVVTVSGLDEYHRTRSLGRQPYAKAPPTSPGSSEPSGTG